LSALAGGIGPHDHVEGPLDAAVQLVEYGDYECPYCGRAFVEVEEVRRVLAGRLLFAYRHFPLSRLHPHAEAAAEAAEAAGAQGRFWQMHRLLYESQGALARTDLLAHAEALRLDLDRFAADLDGGRFRERIHRERVAGARSGVNGTPSFFVNGERYDGRSDADGLLEALAAGGLSAGI
jgi:protein-disulfide isomerase